MGLMHVGVGEGPEIIQMFGRGVRLKGWNMSLKRHRKSDAEPPRDSDRLAELETLYIFGLRANYMQTFRDLLQKEGVRTEQETFTLPVTWNFAKKTDLKLIRLKQGRRYETSDERPALPNPDAADAPVVTLGRYSRLQSVASGDLTDGEGAAISLEPYADGFDATRVYDRVIWRKRQRGWHNLTIAPRTIERLLNTDGWYNLSLPPDRLNPTEFRQVRELEDVAVDLITEYADRFWRTRRRRWGHDRIEVVTLDRDDPNNVEAYEISVDAAEDRLVKEAGELATHVRKGRYDDLKMWYGHFRSASSAPRCMPISRSCMCGRITSSRSNRSPWTSTKSASSKVWRGRLSGARPAWTARICF